MGATSFFELAETLEKVRLTRGKNEKVSILAGLLSRVEDDDEVEFAARFATGKATRKGSAEETQVGYSTLIGVLQEVTGVTQAELSKSYLEHGDLSESVAEFIGRKRVATLFQGRDGGLTIRDVASTFEKMTEARGKGSASLKRELLRSLLLRSENALEAKYIVKILSREMRIGLVEGLVEEAIAAAFADGERQRVKTAYLLLGDIGLLARAAKSGRLGEVEIEPMRPASFMLAEPMASAEQIAKYFEGKELFAEFKYDGVRAQLHKRGREIKIFTRRLEEITGSFPEVVEAAAKIQHDFILDGEVVPFKKEGTGPLSFQLLQRRLRRADAEESKSIVPIRYFAFDILYLDGRSVYDEPLAERRKMLWDLIKDSGIHRADTKVVRDAKGVEAYFRESRSLGYEGLILKEPDSPYTPGRRGRYWAKLKEELDTLDVVMVAAEYGHGKRAGKISDYTFAVRDGGDLKVIGKAYSGLTDKEIDEMMGRIKKLATSRPGGYRMDVRPEIVLEVAFDSIQKSDRHDSGYALRFPRIKRIRDDKSLAEIDTLERVKEIYEAQKVKAEAA